MKFLADTMLGRLTKWLRVMGYDTYYQNYYGENEIDELIKEGRLFLSCSKKITTQYPNSFFIGSDLLKNQLQDIKGAGYLTNTPSKWFTRCLICNVLLQVVKEIPNEIIPEYILYQDNKVIRYCPSCKRYFWQGSHRARMVKQLTEWGFEKVSSTLDTIL